MSYIRTADAWADGVKQTLNPDGTNAGLNAGAIAGDPSVLANGDIWYQSTANELRARINGATVALGASGASPPFTDTNTLIKGSADATKLMRFEIDGFTAGATRVLTPPDANITLAGQDFANTFTLDQSIGTGIVLRTDGSADFALASVPVTISAAGTLQWGPSTLDPDGSILISGGTYFSANVTTGITSIGSGIVQVDFNGTALGFFGATPAAQIAVADLTNNAVGGTADTIATLGQAIYATDAPDIEGNFNQLATKVNEILAAIKAYGLFTP